MANLIDGGNRARTRTQPTKKPSPVTYADRQKDANMVARSAPVPAPAPAPAPVYRGGGGGGGGSAPRMAAAPAAPAPPPAPPRMSLEDYIKGSFLMKSQEAENSRLLEDFDASTMMQQQQVEADQTFRQQDLRRNLDEAGIDNAESKASRGVLRSGFTFQDQDKINAQGEQQQNLIANLLTNFLSQRQQGRVAEQARGRGLLNDRINMLTQDFNKQQAI